MNFETQPNNPERDENDVEKEKESLLFQIRKVIKGIDVSVNLKKSENPFRGSIDFKNGEAQIDMTPEAVREAFRSVDGFLKEEDSEGQTRIDRMREWVENKRESYERRKDEKDLETIRQYAKQEGKEEAEIIEELLDAMGDTYF